MSRPPRSFATAHASSWDSLWLFRQIKQVESRPHLDRRLVREEVSLARVVTLARRAQRKGARRARGGRVPPRAHETDHLEIADAAVHRCHEHRIARAAREKQQRAPDLRDLGPHGNSVLPNVGQAVAVRREWRRALGQLERSADDARAVEYARRNVEAEIHAMTRRAADAQYVGGWFRRRLHDEQIVNEGRRDGFLCRISRKLGSRDKTVLPDRRVRRWPEFQEWRSLRVRCEKREACASSRRHTNANA